MQQKDFIYRIILPGDANVRNRIRAMREDRDLPQKTVAKAIGISQRKYSYLETGVQLWTDELLIRLAEYYGTSVDYLLELTNQEEPYPKK